MRSLEKAAPHPLILISISAKDRCASPQEKSQETTFFSRMINIVERLTAKLTKTGATKIMQIVFSESRPSLPVNTSNFLKLSLKTFSKTIIGEIAITTHRSRILPNNTTTRHKRGTSNIAAYRALIAEFKKMEKRLESLVSPTSAESKRFPYKAEKTPTYDFDSSNRSLIRVSLIPFCQESCWRSKSNPYSPLLQTSDPVHCFVVQSLFPVKILKLSPVLTKRVLGI